VNQLRIGRRLLRKNCEMKSVNEFQKRVRDEVAAVEKEIQSHNQQVEALTKRLEGLKRADELFDSEQSAIAELVRTSISDGTAPASAATMQKAEASQKPTRAQTQVGRGTQIGRGKMKTVRAQLVARTASQNGGLKRIDMIAAVLKRHRGLSLRELIAALDKEFGWKSTESNVTALLYTNQKKFAHSKPDRGANRPVSWSLK